MPTPARQQYLDIKRRYPEAIVWFRMGDFYEMFDGDAETAARELRITLTSKHFGREKVPLAGIPYHAARGYLARLIRRGYTVAICEQVSEAGHGLVERAVVRLVSPGTVVEPDLLRPGENNYLAAVRPGREGFGLAFVDVTTGEFAATQIDGPESAAALASELDRLAATECLVPRGTTLPVPYGGRLTPIEPLGFEPDVARQTVMEHFRVQMPDAFGCAHLPLALGAAGAILRYLQDTNPDLLGLLTGLRTYSVHAYMTLDPQTRRNLELTRSSRAGDLQRGLLAVLDETRTPMGGRLLRRFLNQPLLDVSEIRRRQAHVAALVAERRLRGALATCLQGTGDLERITSRVRQGLALPRELQALRAGLERVAEVARALAEAPAPLAALAGRLDACPDVAARIERAVATEDGRLIRDGYSRELDEAVASARGGRQRLAAFERAERERTGIRSLKVAHNKVFGYYIEVTTPNRHRVPEDYVCRQTMANCSRYTTPALKELESIVLHAESRIEELERAIYQELLVRLGEEAPRLLATAEVVAHVDVFVALAEVAVRRGYTQPLVDESDVISIVEGRHPAVEAALGANAFVPNDCRLDGKGCRVMLLTGPNMAGKSTYLRQVALIVLLAQIGSFVPATDARIGVVDRIFTRVGAEDDISAGASTFMVEMVETAAILRHATRRSLVVLDEVGRGTSTYDGLALARAIVEYLHDTVGARTLFATHYHELVRLEETLPGLVNFNTAVRQDGERLTFLYQLAPGGAARSYGIHVARLAGLPERVVERATTLLAEMEGATTPAAPGHADGMSAPPALRETPAPFLKPAPSDGPAAALFRELMDLNLAAMTPMEALNWLFEFQIRGTRSTGVPPAGRAPGVERGRGRPEGAT